MALTDNKINVFQDTRYVTRDVEAGAITIYNGALINSNAAGNVVVGTDAASQLFAGVATNKVTQLAGGSAGDNTIRLHSAGSGQSVKLKFTGATKADIGTLVYVKDDEEVQGATAATNDVLVGTIVDIAETNYVMVKI